MTLQEELIKKIDREGKFVSVRGYLTKEIIDTEFEVTDLHETHAFSSSDGQYILEKVNKYLTKFAKILDLFKKDMGTRQAFLLFNKFKKEEPECILSIQFLIRNKKLFCIVNSRSLDVKNKLHVDIKIAKKFCDKICDFYSIELDSIKFRVGSMHYVVK